MHKSILVLEESRMVHELFESALPEDYTSWEVNHESLPDRYIQKAQETNPDIIFLSNQDQKRNYKTVKQLKSSPDFIHTPILLLTSAKDNLDESHLQSIGVRGFVRKPFETSTLQKQINVVLKEEEQKNKDTQEDRLKDLNVVDDDLMDLLAGHNTPEVSLEDLEGELDPTLQLIPEDPTEDDDANETELLAMEDSDELEQADFVDDEIESNLDLDSETSLELDDDSDIELEELDDESDFMDLDEDHMTAIDLDLEEEKVSQSIPIVEGNGPDLSTPLLNVPEDKNDLGFMEIHIMPLRSEEIKSHVVETITEDFDEEEFVKKHSPAELDDEFMTTESEIIMDIPQEGGGDIEIPHEEIVEDFYEGDEIDSEDDSEEGLLELSIEGMEGELTGSPQEDKSEEEVVAFEELEDSEESIEEINIQEMDLLIETDDVELVSLDEPDLEEDEFTTVSQEGDSIDFTAADEDVDVEIDFHSDPMPDLEDDDPQPIFNAFDEEEVDEESLTVSELEKRRSDQLDIELEEIAAAGSEEASATIQEMIGFRQVMKAKYDLPDDDLDSEAEPEDITDDFDNLIGEDEDLFSEVENNFEEEDEETTAEDDGLLAEFPEDDDNTLLADLPNDDESSLLEDMEDKGDSTFLPELPDDDNAQLEDEADDEFSPLLEENTEEDDNALLSELPDDSSLSMDEDSSLLADLPDDEESHLLADEEEGEENFLADELTEEDGSLLEEMAEPEENPFMNEDSANLEPSESDDDLLLDVAESAGSEDDDLELLTNEIDEESDESDLELLDDETEIAGAEEEKLDDIDLLADFDEEEKPELESSIDDEVFEEDDALSGEGLADDMFEEPPDQAMEDISDEFTTADTEDDVFASDGDEDSMMEPMDFPDSSDEANLFSAKDGAGEDLEEPFEEIELLTDNEPEDESESLLQVDEEIDEDVDALVFDEEATGEEPILETPEDLLAMDDDDDFDTTAGSMEDIDFLPIDEDTDDEDIELEVEIDDTSEESLDFDDNTSDSEDSSVDDIDFLPVDDEEANFDGEKIEDIPVVELVEEESEEESDSIADIDFQPDDSIQEEFEEEIPVLADDSAKQDFPDNTISSLDDSDEITIEVPQETFEMNDFNLGDIASDDDMNEISQDADIEDENVELSLMSGIDTVSDGTDGEAAEESYDDIELPTMDEDLPDLPPILNEDEDLEEESFEVFKEPAMEESDIQLMQAKSDFDDFDSEQEIIGLTEDSNVSPNGISEIEREEISKQAQQAAASLTPEFRKKLSAMIEGVVSETVHNTLQEKLPELVDRLVDEEMKD